MNAVLERKLIGSGSFTRVYQSGTLETVEVVSVCKAKLAYAEMSQDNKFAPKIEKTEEEFHYIMPLYPQVMYMDLMECLDDRSSLLYSELRRLHCSDYFAFCEAIHDLNIAYEDKEEIRALARDVANYIDPDYLVFEIRPQNVTHDGKGNLILLDCFFCRSLLNKVRNYEVLIPETRACQETLT